MKPVTRLFLLVICFCSAAIVRSQAVFSLASDFNLQRSVKKGQEYWAVGQVVMGQFNFTPKDAAYAWLGLFTSGRFRNQGLLATAKDPLTIPASVNYDSRTKMGFKHFSLGWKHYYTGSAFSEREPGIYSLAGLGVLLGRVVNIHSTAVDSSRYLMPVLPGTTHFNRLTIDLGIGVEVPVGGDVYLYSELKTVLPLTDYPSPYILDNKYTPYTAMASIGFRILFN